MVRCAVYDTGNEGQLCGLFPFAVSSFHCFHLCQVARLPSTHPSSHAPNLAYAPSDLSVCLRHSRVTTPWSSCREVVLVPAFNGGQNHYNPAKIQPCPNFMHPSKFQITQYHIPHKWKITS